MLTLLLLSFALDPALAQQPGAPARASTADRAATDPEALEARLEAALEDLRREHGFPGATAACAALDGRSAAVAVGESDPEAGTAMRPDDRMLAGSVGKTFVAAIALQLVGEDLLRLDAPLSELLGEAPWFERLPNARALTLRHLLGHTSGVPDHVWSPDFAAALAAEPDRDWSPEQLVAFVLDAEPLFPAGEGFGYADTNYVLVGLAIERVTGASYYDALRERLLEPLALEDTLPQDRRELPGLVQGHTREGNPFGLPARVLVDGRHAMNPEVEYCGGGVLSTSPDLARWALALYGGERVLTAEQRDAMLVARPAPRVGPGNAYGLGVIVGRDEHGPRWGHTGWYPGYGTALAFWPEAGLALALQVNTDDPALRAGFPDAWLEALAAVLLAGD